MAGEQISLAGFAKTITLAHNGRNPVEGHLEYGNSNAFAFVEYVQPRSCRRCTYGRM